MPNRRRMKRFFAVICLLLLSSCAVAQTISKGSDPQLVAAVDALLENPAIASGFQGVLIQSLKTGETLYERNADKTFLPASNNKLLTSGVALEKLGKDWVYRTRVYRTGKIDAKGILHGNLILQGSGDPLLSPDDLKELAAKVKSSGIRDITSGIAYDAQLFDNQALGEGWTWDDEPFYYSAQVSALNVNQNMAYIQVHPGKKAGAGATFVVGPEGLNNKRLPTHLKSTMNWYFRVRTGAAGSKKTLIFQRDRGANVIRVSGSIPLDIKPADNLPTGVTLENPANFATELFFAGLQFRHARFSEWSRYPFAQWAVPQDAVLVAEHVSAPLSIYLKRLNKPSDNLVAECLLKTVGAKVKGKGTANADGTGATVAKEWFQSIGMDTSRVRMADGSGLSRVNFVSPRNLVLLLTHLHSRPDFAVFYDSLPIAGVDGSLRNRMKNTAAANNCHAKTGYVSQVSSLSGYVKTADGEDLVFSILMNNHLAPNSVCRTIQDNIVAKLADYQRGKE